MMYIASKKVNKLLFSCWRQLKLTFSHHPSFIHLELKSYVLRSCLSALFYHLGFLSIEHVVLDYSPRRVECELRTWSFRGRNTVGSLWHRPTLSKTGHTSVQCPMPLSVATLPHETNRQLPDNTAGAVVCYSTAADCRRIDWASVLPRTAPKVVEAGNLYHRWIFAALLNCRWVLESSFQEVVSAGQSDGASEWHRCLSGMFDLCQANSRGQKPYFFVPQ